MKLNLVKDETLLTSSYGMGDDVCCVYLFTVCVVCILLLCVYVCNLYCNAITHSLWDYTTSCRNYVSCCSSIFGGFKFVLFIYRNTHTHTHTHTITNLPISNIFVLIQSMCSI